MSMRKQILQSLKSHAIGNINKHKMNVEIYLENPVGIGEHPDVMGAIEQELEMISKYHEQIEVIEKYL
jgi:hypothetical protein